MAENSRGAAPQPPSTKRQTEPYGVLTRRQTLGALAALTATTAVACSNTSHPGTARNAPAHPAVPPGGEPFAAVTGNGRGLLLQVLAHPDDDLYFMNPDTQQQLRAGSGIVNVYVTAGEAAGVNRPIGTRRDAVTPDKPAYSAARHQGLRQAYAELLGMDRFTRWQRRVIDLPGVPAGSLRAESNELVSGNRRVQLIFLNIAMLSENLVRLPQLWDTPDVRANTLAAADSPLQETFHYRHETLVAVLAGLMDRFRPTVIHTLDPDPDFQVHDREHPKDNDQPGCSDHRDHTPVAQFTWKAISQWVTAATRRDGRAPRFLTTAFRGYYNQRWPHNLPPALVEQKARLVEAYGGSPDWQCGVAAGCGDYSQGGDRPLHNRKGWIRSTHYRYPGTLPALTTDGRGRVVAYGVLGTQAVRWQETAPRSGRFGAPRNLGGGPLAPTLCAVEDTAGRQSLFALRFSALEGQGRADTREIVVLEQRSPDGAFRAWRSLGTPEDDAESGRRVGCPVAVATPDGRVHLYARTARKGIATRIRDAAGRWGPWQTVERPPALEGVADSEEIQDGLTVVLDREKRICLFGTGRYTVHHWRQEEPGGPLVWRTAARIPASGDQPGAAFADDGSLTLVYRPPADARPYLYRLPAGGPLTSPEDPAFGAQPVGLRHFEGYGPLTAHSVRGPGGKDTLLLAGKTLDGEIQLRWVTLGKDSEGRAAAGARPLRSPAQLVPVGNPALLPGGPDRACVVGVSPTATPWIWRPAPTSKA
ncbi:PIG-L family deacetylase [Streptomyces palmae]|uniref:PIG-L family deacetylase n=1 Tax=Streptomyces palmae TaxID=1701085 RepID=A0A4Z0GIN8_9ACTN|nr:PIG-L family deacetylase [Streptomyces palmae]TGA95528.1 PIG-L family deacetylase [Streptomyces palmae]